MFSLIQFVLKTGDYLVDTAWFEKFYLRVIKNSSCRKLIIENYHGSQPSLSELAKYPKVTLGYQLSQHIELNNLNIYPRINQKNKSKKNYLKERSREFHDILHVVFGLGVTVEDEIGVNTVLLFQSGYPMSFLIFTGGFVRLIFTDIFKIRKAIKLARHYWKLSYEIRNVFAVKWEDLLEQDLDLIRKNLGINIL